jgi:hypothetical protein
MSKKAMKWYDPEDEAGYGGVQKLKEKTKMSKSKTEKWMSNQLAYTLNRPIRKRFPTRAYKTGGINDLWQADLMEMIPYSKINSGYKYILTVIDVFSRFARAVPLKSKSAKDMHEASKKIFNNQRPRHLQTDEGKEFYNSSVKSILDKLKIKHYSVYSQYKAAVVERFNRTLREKLAKHFVATGKKKWVDVLPKLITSYNNSKHRGLNGLRPVDIGLKEQSKLWYAQNSEEKVPVPKYKVGDHVRISRISASPFIKNFRNNWSDEVYTISKIDSKSKPIMYIIKDIDGEQLGGKFYTEELQVISPPTVFRIQKILKSKGVGKHKQHYVKWHGYQKPTWINASDIL